MTSKDDPGNILEIISTSFNAEQVDTMAFKLFPEIFDDFTPGMGKGQRMRAIILAAHKQGRTEELLTYVERQRRPQGLVGITFPNNANNLIKQFIIIITGILILTLVIVFVQGIRNLSNTNNFPNVENSNILSASEETPQITQNEIVVTQSSTTLTPKNMPTLLPTPTSTFSPDFVRGYTPTIKTVSDYQYVLVPAGSFESGNGTVSMSEFWIGMFEVTINQFADFLNSQDGSNMCSSESRCFNTQEYRDRLSFDGNEYQAVGDYGNHPMTRVSWYGASDFCKWIGSRLPFEIEWRKAASWHPITKETAQYPWGEYPPTDRLANFGSIYQSTLPVGSFPDGRSVVGAFDMSGNVWEFVGVTDSNNTNRTWYGGGWDSPANDINISSSRTGRDTNTSDDIGFRCIRVDNN